MAGAALGLLFLVLLIWLAVLLSSNPIGELASEFLYLNAGELRMPLLLALSALAVEAAELFYPVLGLFGLPPKSARVDTVLNLLQGALLLLATVQVLLVALRYTHRGLERRIRDSIDTLAFLQGQRRRRRRL